MSDRNPLIDLFAGIRTIGHPLTDEMLRPLAPEVEQVQWAEPLSDEELRRLAQLMENYPRVTLRIYGHYQASLDLSFLKYFTTLRNFYLDVWSVTDWEGLRHLPPSLESLGLGRTKKRLSLKVLRAFPGLRDLFIEGHNKDFDSISSLTQLEKLHIRSVTLPDLSTLLPLRKLWWLAIKLGGTNNLELLPSIGHLKYLELWLISGLTDISAVGGVTTLQFLFLQALRRVTKLPTFSKLDALRALTIETLKGLEDYSSILEAKNLEQLAIFDSRVDAEQLQQLRRIPTLRRASFGLGSMKRNEEAKRIFNLPPATGKLEFDFR